jgi:ribonuclease P protein component
MTFPLKSNFPSDLRIRKSSEFEEVFEKGSKLYTEHYTIVYTPNSLGFPRLGLVVGKRCGNALRRNRIKRILREVFRRNKSLFDSLDVLILVKRWSKILNYNKVEEEIAEIIRSKLV